MDRNIILSALEWFLTNKRDEPWRENTTPYRVWISEIMLQQTTVATVKKYFLRFMERFPRLEDLAKAPEEEVLHLWAGLGYYSRARNILKTAQIIQQENYFPKTRKELLKLPGIGPYTSAAISSIAYNQPDALVDTNVDRVLGRFCGLMRSNKNFDQDIILKSQEIMDQVAVLVPDKIWAWNQVIMEIGALLCSVSKTNCKECPLSPQCQACLSKNPISFPGDKQKPIITSLTESYVIKYVGQKIVLEQNNTTRRKGLYDFIKIEEDSFFQKLGEINYRISNNRVTRNIFEYRDDNYQLNGKEILISPSEAEYTYPLTSPCKKIIDRYILRKKKMK